MINSTLCPPTTSHAFSFTLPKHDTLATVARTRLDGTLNPSVTTFGHPVDYAAYLAPDEISQMTSGPEHGLMTGARNMSAATELTFYGITLTVWTHADKHRGRALKHLKAQRERVARGGLPETLRMDSLPRAATERVGQGKKRTSLPWGLSRKGSVDNASASETETGMSDSDLDGLGPPGARSLRNALSESRSVVESLPDESGPVIEDGGDVFWMPYAITLSEQIVCLSMIALRPVSRHPIYDFMQDFLRLSVSEISVTVLTISGRGTPKMPKIT